MLSPPRTTEPRETSTVTRERPSWLQAAQDHWKHRGDDRPPFAVPPGDGQESVWDYPRPPVLVADQRAVVVADDLGPLVRTHAALRVLETASPPTFYVPIADTAMDRLVAAAGQSFCEWKGPASYWALAHAPELPVAWSYPRPFEPFEGLVDHLGFYPGRVRCTVDGEVVRPQDGGFYGGWITEEIIGPFKGEADTSGW